MIRVITILGFFIIFAFACTQKSTDWRMLESKILYKANFGSDYFFLNFHKVGRSSEASLIIGDQAIYRQQKVIIEFDEKSEKFKLFEKKNKAEIWEGQYLLADSVLTLSIEKPNAMKLAFKKSLPMKCPSTQNRYCDSINNKVEIKEVVYGKAEGYYVSKPVKNISAASYPSILADVVKELSDNIDARMLELKMDVYQAKNDNCEQRPLLVLIHGGSFVIGDKREAFQEQLGYYFAHRGYVVASINYRLGYFFIPGLYKNLERAMYKAVQDTRAALRYLSSHSKQFRIDPTYVFVAGNSAGGFTALNTAFMSQDEVWESTESDLLGIYSDLGCLDCSTNNEKGKFTIRGIINMWGALSDTTLIDEDEKIPLLLIHGTSDQIVPINYEYPFHNIDPTTSAFFSDKVGGSEFIYNRAKRKKIPVTLVKIKGQGHEPQCNDRGKFNENLPLIKKKMNQFMFNILKEKDMELMGPEIIRNNDPVSEYSVDLPNSYKTFWQVKGGLVANVDGNSSVVLWNSESKEHKIIAIAINSIGVVQKKEMRITIKAK